MTLMNNFLVNFYEANGYNLESLEDSKLVFVKDGTTSVLLPNKYYLGEKDGYLQYTKQIILVYLK